MPKRLLCLPAACLSGALLALAIAAAPAQATDSCVTVLSLAFDPQSADVAYAGLYGDFSACAGIATVVRSDDGGRSWQPAAAGLPLDSWGRRLSFSPDGRLFAVLQIPAPSSPLVTVGVFVSGNGARSWSRVPVPLSIEDTCAECGEPLPTLGFDPEDPRALYLAGEGGLLRTRDAGATWQRLGDSIEYFAAYAVAVDPFSAKQLYVGLEDAHLGAGVYLSHNGGTTWARVDHAVASEIVVSPADPAVVWAVHAYGVTKSSARGQNWREALNTGRSVDPAGYPTILLADAVDADTAYVASWTWNTSADLTRSKLVKTSDGGRHWTLASQGLPSDFVMFSLAQSPVRPQRLLFGNIGGLYLSEDGAQTWTRVGKGLARPGF